MSDTKKGSPKHVEELLAKAEALLEKAQEGGWSPDMRKALSMIAMGYMRRAEIALESGV